MRNNYFKAMSLVVLMLSDLTTFAQTQLQKEHITGRYDKQVINQLQDQFSA